MRMKLWSAVLLTSGVLACIGVGFGVAQASIPDSAGIIHACYNRQGQLRIAEINSRGCRRSETAISWPNTAATRLAGWQLIQCTLYNVEGDVTVSGSPLCSPSGPDQATILCPSGKLAVQEAGSLLSYGYQGYATVKSDGSGAVFDAPYEGIYGGSTIQLVCANGSA